MGGSQSAASAGPRASPRPLSEALGADSEALGEEHSLDHPSSDSSALQNDSPAPFRHASADHHPHSPSPAAGRSPSESFRSMHTPPSKQNFRTWWRLDQAEIESYKSRKGAPSRHSGSTADRQRRRFGLYQQQRGHRHQRPAARGSSRSASSQQAAQQRVAPQKASTRATQTWVRYVAETLEPAVSSKPVRMVHEVQKDVVVLEDSKKEDAEARQKRALADLLSAVMLSRAPLTKVPNAMAMKAAEERVQVLRERRQVETDKFFVPPVSVFSPKSFSVTQRKYNDISVVDNLYYQHLCSRARRRQIQEHPHKRQHSSKVAVSPSEEEERNAQKHGPSQNMERQRRLWDDFWVLHVLPEWDVMCTKPLVGELWKRQGFSVFVRRFMWPVVIGNQFSRLDFGSLLVPDAECISVVNGTYQTDDVDLKRNLELICSDVNRMLETWDFPCCGYMWERSENDKKKMREMYRIQLLRTLWSFTTLFPKVGYVQGFSYLAGIFLLHMPTELSVSCLANLLHYDYFSAYIDMDVARIRRRMALFDKLLALNDPAAQQMLLSKNVVPDCYLMEWLMTLFSKPLSPLIASTIWDQYFLRGEAYVFFVAVAFVQLLAPVLKHYPPHKVLRSLREPSVELLKEVVKSHSKECKILMKQNSVRNYNQHRSSASIDTAQDDQPELRCIDTIQSLFRLLLLQCADQVRLR